MNFKGPLLLLFQPPLSYDPVITVLSNWLNVLVGHEVILMKSLLRFVDF